MGITSGFQWFGQRVTDLVLGEIDQRLEQAGQKWLAIAEPLTPIKTGAMRAGLFYRVENRTLVVGGTAPATIFQDRGTRNIPGKFFVERALNEVGGLFGAGIDIEFNNVPLITAPVLSHKGTYIVPSGIQPRPLTQAQHRQVRANAAVSKRLHRGNVRRAGFRVKRGF